MYQVPTSDVSLAEIGGDWYLVEYVNSHDGKPTGAHTPYLCPEVMIEVTARLAETPEGWSSEF